MIDVTGVDLIRFAQKAYELSVPRGLGFYQPYDTPLSDAEAAALVEPNGSLALSMDYVKGRGCKMHVRRAPDGKLTINDSWYDHTDADLDALLAVFGMSRGAGVKHGPGCECPDCLAKR